MRWIVGAAVALSAAALVTAAACSSVDDAETRRDRGGPPPGAGAATAADASAGEGSTLSVELGTGSSFFVPLQNGDAVTLVRGKQGYQHIWISARILQPSVHEAVVTITTRRQDGRWSGPDLTAAVTLDAVDGGSGSEKVGLTGLLDYGAIGKAVVVHVDVKTADGLHGADERIINVLPPIQGECTLDAGTTTCSALCGAFACSICETGSAAVGYLHEGDAAGPTVESCTATFEIDAVHDYACCCCR